MAEIVNLRRERKRRERQQSMSAAAEHRAKFGLTLAEREVELRTKARQQRVLDAAKVDK